MEDVSALKQAPEGRPSLHPALELSPRARNEVLLAILLALFLSALDQTIVGTALPRIVTDLSGNDLYTWVVTSYLLTSTITGPIYGKLSDLYGRKPMLLIGIVLFLLGSFLSGLSQDMWQLILFRGVQGLGAGAIFPVSLAVIGDLFTPAERGKYQGLFGAVFGVSALVGPWLGGFITDALSWHWVFFINLPIGAVALYVIWRVLPTFRRPDASRSIDYLGVAVFTGAVVPFLVGITNKQTGEWTDPQVGGFMLLGLALGVVFVLIERRAIEPIVDLGLFRMRSYSSSIVATFLASFGFFGAVIFLPRFFQFVRGSSATQSGYQILPLLVGVIFSSILAGQIVARTGRYKVLIVVSLGIAALGLALWTQLHAGTDIWVLWLWMFVTGLGLGPTLAVFTIIVQASVPVREARRRDQQPDLLPADRRLHRPRDHGNGLRRHAARPGPGATCERGGPAAVGRSVRRPLHFQQREPHGRGRGPGGLDPGGGPGPGPGHGQAPDPGDHRGNPRGVRTGRGGHLRGRGDSDGPGARGCALHEGGAAPRDVRQPAGAGGQGRVARARGGDHHRLTGEPPPARRSRWAAPAIRPGRLRFAGRSCPEALPTLLRPPGSSPFRRGRTRAGWWSG